MKKIEKFVSSDGAEFESELDALHREQVLAKIGAIEMVIPDRPDTTDFANGGGYIQHERDRVVAARNAMIRLAGEEYPALRYVNAKSYAFSRYLDDNRSPLFNLYHRLIICMDDATWREYGQGYFKIHPEEAKDVQVN